MEDMNLKLEKLKLEEKSLKDKRQDFLDNKEKWIEELSQEVFYDKYHEIDSKYREVAMEIIIIEKVLEENISYEEAREFAVAYQSGCGC